MATLKDISLKTGISVAQVSRALNGYSDVSAKTKEAVKQAAQELNYTPNLSARRLVTGRSNHIGLVKRHHEKLAQDTTFLENFIGLSRACAAHNLQLSLHLVEGDANILDVYSSLYNSNSIGGFIVNEPRRSDERVTHLIEQGIPFAVHGRDPDQNGYAFVDIDNFSVGYDLTQHLILQGHSRIALINGEAERDYGRSRLQGYKKALADYNIAFDQELVAEGHMSSERGQSATLKLMQFAKSPPSALVCAHLLLVQGAYNALGLLGLKVPDDVSVVGHNDAHMQLRELSLVPSLTGTYSPVSEAYEPLADFLDRQLAGEDARSCQKFIPVEFVSGNSVAFNAR